MKANLEIRNKLGDYLKGLGIPADRIESAKFSSTPKFGMFSEKARSYRIENEMRVTVQDENEFQGTASTVDKWAEVQFSDVEFEYADKEQQKQNVIAKACDNADERKKIYEQKLGLKLTPARFNEGEVTQRMEAPGNTNVPYVTGSSYGSAMTTPAAMATDESGHLVWRNCLHGPRVGRIYRYKRNEADNSTAEFEHFHLPSAIRHPLFSRRAVPENNHHRRWPVGRLDWAGRQTTEAGARSRRLRPARGQPEGLRVKK